MCCWMSRFPNHPNAPEKFLALAATRGIVAIEGIQIMSKRRGPWFWNTAVLARLAWLLLAAVLAAYTSIALAHWGWP